jgi:hypothetical protein
LGSADSLLRTGSGTGQEWLCRLLRRLCGTSCLRQKRLGSADSLLRTGSGTGQERLSTLKRLASNSCSPRKQRLS